MERPLVLTVKECQQRMDHKLTLATIYKLIRAGEFPAVHAGRKVLIPTARFEEWLNTSWAPPAKGQN